MSPVPCSYVPEPPLPSVRQRLWWAWTYSFSPFSCCRFVFRRLGHDTGNTTSLTMTLCLCARSSSCAASRLIRWSAAFKLPFCKIYTCVGPCMETCLAFLSHSIGSWLLSHCCFIPSAPTCPCPLSLSPSYLSTPARQQPVPASTVGSWGLGWVGMAVLFLSSDLVKKFGIFSPGPSP